MEKNKITYIYALKDPDTKLVRYIGKTVNRPKARFLEHIKRADAKRTHKDKWILKLRKEGKLPELEVLDEIKNWKEGLVAEIAYIKLFKSLGADLCNHTNGGDGLLGYKHTQEFKRNLSKRMKENPVVLSIETRKELGRKHSEFLKTHPEKCIFNILNKDKEKRKSILKLANKASTAVTSKKVYEVDDNKNIICSFNSIAEVASFHGNIDSSIIAFCARKNTNEGRKLKYKGHIYVYEINDKVYKKPYNKGCSKNIKVTDKDNNIQFFNSFRDFARSLGLKDCSGIYIAKLTKKNKTYKNYKIEIL